MAGPPQPPKANHDGLPGRLAESAPGGLDDGDVELSADQRRYILEVFPRLEELTYHELLEVPRDADRQAVKRAYFELARVIHPDRYYGKRLGSFKAKMEAIFARLTRAYETLSDAAARAEYEAALPAPAGAPVKRAPVAAPAAPRPAPAAPRPAPAAPGPRPAAQSPDPAKAQALAARHAQAAGRALAVGDLAAAAGSYREALRLAPDDAALRQAAADVQRQLAERSCAAYRRQAALEERHGHWSEAAATWRRVLMLQPGDPEATQRLAAAEARAGGREPR